MKVIWVFWFPEYLNLDLSIYNIVFLHKKIWKNTLKIENMGNKYNYENVLGEIACYIAKECNLTHSEAVGVVMNDDWTDAVIEEIQKSDKIDIEDLDSRHLKEELC